MSQDAVYFNVWFSACMRLRERLSYYDSTRTLPRHLLGAEKALCSVEGIADFEAYFRACYRHAVLHRHRTLGAMSIPARVSFCGCATKASVPEEELGACERLVLDILAFMRRASHEVCLPAALLRVPVRAVTACWRSMPTTPSRAARG
ncbi:MAG: hypothetical protein ACLT1W_14775 [Alistipes onderdonkii]